MSLEQVVAAPFQRTGKSHLSEQEFVVALSLHRDWFSPAQAKRVVERASADGILEQTDDGLQPLIDVRQVSVPGNFVPDESVLQTRSTFEVILARVVEEGYDKRAAVGAINRLQQELHVTIETAAVIHATRLGIDCESERNRVLGELTSETDQDD